MLNASYTLSILKMSHSMGHHVSFPSEDFDNPYSGSSELSVALPRGECLSYSCLLLRFTEDLNSVCVLEGLNEPVGILSPGRGGI